MFFVTDSERDNQVDNPKIMLSTSSRKHIFLTKKDGTIDHFAYSKAYHNGPMCIKCNIARCECCSQEWLEEDCSVEHFVSEDGRVFIELKQ